MKKISLNKTMLAVHDMSNTKLILMGSEHKIIGIDYQRDVHEAPKILYVKSGFEASKIITTAAKLSVPVIEAPNFVAELLQTSAPGQIIDEMHYKAMASYLARAMRYSQPSTASDWLARQMRKHPSNIIASNFDINCNVLFDANKSLRALHPTVSAVKSQIPNALKYPDLIRFNQNSFEDPSLPNILEILQAISQLWMCQYNLPNTLFYTDDNDLLPGQLVVNLRGIKVIDFNFIERKDSKGFHFIIEFTRFMRENLCDFINTTGLEFLLGEHRKQDINLVTYIETQCSSYSTDLLDHMKILALRYKRLPLPSILLEIFASQREQTANFNKIQELLADEVIKDLLFRAKACSAKQKIHLLQMDPSVIMTLEDRIACDKNIMTYEEFKKIEIAIKTVIDNVHNKGLSFVFGIPEFLHRFFSYHFASLTPAPFIPLEKIPHAFSEKHIIDEPIRIPVSGLF